MPISLCHVRNTILTVPCLVALTPQRAKAGKEGGCYSVTRKQFAMHKKQIKQATTFSSQDIIQKLLKENATCADCSDKGTISDFRFWAGG